MALKILGIQLFYPGEDNVSILKAIIERQINKTNTIPPIRNGIHHFLRFSIFIFTPIMAEMPKIASLILVSYYFQIIWINYFKSLQSLSPLFNMHSYKLTSCNQIFSIIKSKEPSSRELFSSR